MYRLKSAQLYIYKILILVIAEELFAFDTQVSDTIIESNNSSNNRESNFFH